MSGRSVLFMSQTGRTLGTWNIAEVTGIRGNKVVDKEIKMGNRLTGYARGRCVPSANEVLKIALGWNLRVWPQSTPGREGRNMGGANR
jgi:hypothetical protein